MKVEKLKGNKNGQKHGLGRTRIYRIWHGMYCRCYCPNLDNYKYYGGKGIKICDEWKSTKGLQRKVKR